MYDHDSNAILVHPLKTRQASEITQAWTNLHTKLSRHGHEIKHLILDNECSHDLRQAFKKNKIDFQLVPPNVHRRNAAERAIRTFKAHFLAGLATCDPDFPISEWDRLLDQAEMTLNMLRTSRCHPKLSAYTYLHGPHDFNKAPLAPPGTKVVVHKKPGVRNTWGYHGKLGWYRGPALEHYRCFKCFMPSTAKEIVTDTVRFIPKKIKFPQLNLNVYLQLAIEKIIGLLETNNQQNNGLQLSNHYHLLKSFKQVASSLNNTSLQPELPSPPMVPNNLKHLLDNIKNSKSSLPSTPFALSPRVPKPPPYNKEVPIRFPIHPFLKPTSHQTPMATNTPHSSNHKVLVPYLHSSYPLPTEANASPQLPLHPNLNINHIFDDNGKKISLDKLLTTPTTNKIWERALNNELG